MKTKSIWGKPPTRLYRLINLAKKDWENDFTACVVGCSDGKFLMPFARRKIFVTGYDIDQIALYGGYKDFPIVKNKIKYLYNPCFQSKKFELETKRVLGIVERLEEEKISKFAKIEKKDFYHSITNKRFNVVFTSCSLHYSVNEDCSLEEKIKKLQKIVLPTGYLYIDYMMAIDENDYINYPSSKFFRKNQIKNYFDDDWDILTFRENHYPTFEAAHVDCVKDHFHRFGYILARRKR